MTSLPPSVETTLAPRASEVEGLPVRRALPLVRRRTLGPFVFLDHMGPTTLAAGAGVDVPPHPHIGLATVTYLFDGALDHRDSLGVRQRIEPGAMNWMTAGRGIVHSERSPADQRGPESRVHGLQAWVALPRGEEQCEPRFDHHPAADLPALERDGVRTRVLVGTVDGVRSPVRAASPTVYAEHVLEAGASLTVDDPSAERALYVVDGTVRVDAVERAGPLLLVLRPDAHVLVEAPRGAHLVLFGGAPLDGHRTVHWNFVASERARIEAARRAWAAGEFPDVPGDPGPPVPLPE